MTSLGVDVYDASTFEHLCALRPSRQVLQAALSPDGGAVATTYARPGDGESVRYVSKQWEVATAREVGRVEHDELGTLLYEPDGNVCLVPDGEVLAFSADGRVRMQWSTGADELLIFDNVRGKHRLPVLRPSAAALSPDGRWLALGQWGAIDLWETATGTQKWSLEAPGSVLAFSGNGALLAIDQPNALGEDAHTAIVDVKSGEILRTLAGGGWELSALSFGPQLGLLLTHRRLDDAVRQWDSYSGELLESLELPIERPTRLAFRAEGELLVRGEGRAETECWSPPGQWSERGAFVEPRGPASSERRLVAPTRLEASSGAGRVRATGLSGLLYFRALGETERTTHESDIELEVGDRRHILAGDDETLHELALDPQATLLAAAYGKLTRAPIGSVRVWRVESGEQLLHLAEGERAFSVAFAAGGELLVASCESGPLYQPVSWIHVWRIPGGQLRHSFAVPGDHNTKVRFAVSPDGGVLAASGIDGVVRVWDLESGAQQLLRGHTDEVCDVAFSADGALLASASHDGSVRLWS